MIKRRYTRQIIIRRVESPPELTPESKLEWICECLGIDAGDELAREIFKELVLASEKGEGVSTREMKEKAHVTQGAIVYHMNSFMRSGIIVKQGRRYYLRSRSLENTIEDIEQDMIRVMSRMRKIAKLLEDDFRMRL
jgi:predicted transcriptional regulator